MNPTYNVDGKLLDYSKPFIEVIERRGDAVLYGYNLPNDSIGDNAFEWDFDGSQRARWEKYISELEAKGIRGQLNYIQVSMKYNPLFDSPSSVDHFPLESYSLMFIP